MNSKIIYQNLCEVNKNRAPEYRTKSGLQRHHIIPKHMGGSDTEENFTYLNKREHMLAHYLLWRIHKCPLDLGAMKMISGHLSPKRRSLLGKWCADNGVGIHNESYINSQTKKERDLKGIKTQMENNIGIFDPEKRSEYASLGGKASCTKNESFIYWNSPEGRKKRSSKGGKAMKGYVNIHNTKLKKKTKIHRDRLEDFLEDGWELGTGTKFYHNPETREQRTIPKWERIPENWIQGKIAKNL